MTFKAEEFNGYNIMEPPKERTLARKGLLPAASPSPSVPDTQSEDFTKRAARIEDTQNELKVISAPSIPVDEGRMPLQPFGDLDSSSFNQYPFPTGPIRPIGGWKRWTMAGGAAILATAIGLFAASRGGAESDNKNNPNTPKPKSNEPGIVIPGGVPSIVQATATLESTPTIRPTATPTVSPTRAPEVTLTEAPTPTVPIATPTPDRTAQIISEQERRKNFVHTSEFNGEQAGLDKIEFKTNPRYPEAEKALFDLAMITHEKGFLAHNPEAASKVDQSVPGWYEKLVFAGGGQYTVRGHKLETFKGDQEMVDTKIEPMYGVRSIVEVNNKLLERPGNYVKGSIMFNIDRQGYVLVDEKGAVTLLTAISKAVVEDPSTKSYIDKMGLGTFLMGAQYVSPTYIALGNKQLTNGARGITLTIEESKAIQGLFAKEVSSQPVEKPYTFITTSGKIKAPLLIFPEDTSRKQITSLNNPYTQAEQKNQERSKNNIQYKSRYLTSQAQKRSKLSL